MSANRRERRAEARAERKAAKPIERAVPITSPTGSQPFKTAGLFLAGILLGMGILYLVKGGSPAQSPDSQTGANAKSETTGSNLSLGKLLEMPEDELARQDIALVNLVCSDGLPGRGTITISDSLLQLERMTAAVRSETARNFHRFKENPAEYQNSEEFYRVGMIMTVLGQDFGIRYNPAKIATPSVANLQDLSFYETADDIFLSGLAGERRMGTCSSMPVLVVAVGRRLGYPMKLVPAKGHLFCRWDDGKVQRNFETTNGVHSDPDSYYQSWPFPVSDEEVKRGWYLRSLTPKEELAVFLSLRAQVLLSHNRTVEAISAYAQTNILHPNHPDYRKGLARVAKREAGILGLIEELPPMVVPEEFPLYRTVMPDVNVFNRMNQQQFPFPQPKTNTRSRQALPSSGRYPR